MSGLEVMVVNPHRLRDSKGHFIKGKKKYRKNPHHKKHRAKRRHNPHALAAVLGKKRHSRRYRRNPAFGDTFAALLAPLGGGAVALGMDALVGYATASRPDLQLKLQTGLARPAIEAAAGLGLGLLVGGLFKAPRMGAYLAAGGLSVAGYNLLRLVFVKMVPTAPLPLGEVEEYPALGFDNPAMLVRPEGMGASELGPDRSSLAEFMPASDGGGMMGEFMREGSTMGSDSPEEIDWY